jgi:hypothetical protein
MRRRALELTIPVGPECSPAAFPKTFGQPGAVEPRSVLRCSIKSFWAVRGGLLAL